MSYMKVNVRFVAVGVVQLVISMITGLDFTAMLAGSALWLSLANGVQQEQGK
jgi:hypothetical protein